MLGWALKVLGVMLCSKVAEDVVGKIAPAFDKVACKLVKVSKTLLNVAVDMYCGEVAGAIMDVLKPLIMCNFPKPFGHGMCQETACYNDEFLDLPEY
jgi:hypothetical protein